MSTPQELRIIKRLLKLARCKETMSHNSKVEAQQRGAMVGTIFFFKGEAHAYGEFVKYLQVVEQNIMDGIESKKPVVTHVVEEDDDS